MNTAKEKLISALLNSNSGISVIIGLSKNAGKTSFLNWIINNMPENSYGVITTGRDGEENDLVTGLKKPKVMLPANTIYSTWDGEISKQSPLIEILTKLPMKAVSKDLWLIKTKAAIEAEVVGPASVADQIRLAKVILSYGAKHVFIDGSLDRKAVAGAEDIDSVIISASPVSGKTDEIIEELDHLRLLSIIPKNEEKCLPETCCYRLNGIFFETDLKRIYGNESEIVTILAKKPDFVYLPGALTDRSYDKLNNSLESFYGVICLKNPLHLKLNKKNLRQLIKKNLCVSHTFSIQGISLNSYAVDGNHLDSESLRTRVRKEFPDIPVIDVRETG